MCFLNTRLDQAITKFFKSYSRTYLKKCILSNQVFINNKKVNIPKKKIYYGDLITVFFFKSNEVEILDKNIPLNIIYEDEHLLILNKQTNMVVHPGAGNKNGTIFNALLHNNKIFKNIPRSGIVHRLDKDTTGLMVIAKSLIVYKKLKNLFKSRDIHREYEAIIIGNVISGGVISAPISRNIYKRTKMAVNKNGKSAVTYYKIIENFNDFTHVKVKLNSGRTHQIRVHMSYIRHPLVGDQIYGGKKFLKKGIDSIILNKIKNFPRQALHAKKLSFFHPIKNTFMSWKTNLPKDIANLIEFLKFFNK
ncbi:23S rRNA pseudouridine(1911/1915/1917) synthase RluD [Buchnera aphidicola (Mindarus keteleerifoliae)]